MGNRLIADTNFEETPEKPNARSIFYGPKSMDQELPVENIPLAGKSAFPVFRAVGQYCVHQKKIF